MKTELDWARERHAVAHAGEQPRIANLEAVCRKILISIQLDTRPPIEEVAALWRTLLPPFLAAHSQPVELTLQGVLKISCDNATVAFELRGHEARLRRALAEKFAGIKQMRVRQ